MSDNNIGSNSMKKLSIKDIYDLFEIPHNVRLAKKFLQENYPEYNVSKKTAKTRVHRILRDIYYDIVELSRSIYSYTLTGYMLDVRLSTKQKPQQFSFTFQTQKKYTLYPINIVADEGKSITFTNKAPTYYYDECPKEFEPFLETFLTNVAPGPIHYFAYAIEDIKERKIPKHNKQLKNIPIFNDSINVPFHGFITVDSGNNMCVPETILHHLQSNGREKKTTLKHIIQILEQEYTDEYNDDSSDDDISDDEEEETDEVLLKGKRGYTPLDIIRTLEHFKCRGRLVDVKKQQFLTTDMQMRYNHHLCSFCGMVYNNHLYYCTDKNFVTSLSCVRSNSSSVFAEQIYEKKKHERKKQQYQIIETADLKEQYKSFYAEDKKVKLIQTLNGKIVQIQTNENVLMCANPSKTLMEEMLGDKFDENQNEIKLGWEEFTKFFPNHPNSHFTKQTYDALDKHGNIVESFEEPTQKVCHSYDIIKCRTSKLLKNELGAWEIVQVTDQIEEFDGDLNSPGLYKIELNSSKETEFFMRGNSWYSQQFIQTGISEGYKVTVVYQLKVKKTLPSNYFEKFVKAIIAKYPNPNHYKNLINKGVVGMFGKTQTKNRRGYIEADFDMAVSAFWQNNKDQIGFIIDDLYVKKEKWRKMKGSCCNIDVIQMHDKSLQYIVESTEYKTMYENNLPIYNKVLENEFLALYKLKKALLDGMPGKLIKIKTDEVVVQGKHNKIALCNEIGGIKYKKVEDVKVKLKAKFLQPSIKIDTSMNWNIIYEKKGAPLEMPVDSYLVLGWAGYGKSYLVKQQPEYDALDTLRLAFTNVATENIGDSLHPANTLNSYFGINYKTGKCCLKKLNNLKNIKTIIISEVFMIPSVIMGHLSKIKEQFPYIKFICEGDPTQNRPVKEENINWLKTKLLYNLCNGNLIQLTINKRNDETENYEKILDDIRLDEWKYEFRPPQRVNICRTNAMRVTLNDTLMDKKHGIFISKNKNNKYSQDIWLTLDTPVQCVKNDKKLGIKNGKFYTIHSIAKNKIEFTDGLSIEGDAFDLFASNFVVAYAYTNHKIQGLTIKENFNIYEWEKMYNGGRTEYSEKYTAYSRTSDGKNVRIIENASPNWKLVNELKRFFNPNYCIYKWTSTNCNDIYVGHAKNFKEREQQHRDRAKIGHEDLYVKMRETGIESWNMEIVEEFYAPNRTEALVIEQKWVDELGANLNMMNAFTIKK